MTTFAAKLSNGSINLSNGKISFKFEAPGRNYAKQEENGKIFVEAINKAMEIDPYRRYIVIPFSRKTFNSKIEELYMIDMFELTMEKKKVKETQTCGMI